MRNLERSAVRDRITQRISIVSLAILLLATGFAWPLVLPSATIAATATASGPQRYVAPWGSDRNTGKRGSPWRTLQKAANVVSAGTTVWVRGGTYKGFAMTRSGTMSAPIAFKRFPGDARPKLVGRATVPDVIRLTSVHDIVIAGFDVSGAVAAREGAGILVENGSSRIRISSNVIHHNRSYGINVYSSTSVRIAGNDVRHNAIGIIVARRGAGVVISGNRVHANDRMVVNTSGTDGDDHGAVGIAFVHSTGRVRALNNRIWANRARSYDYGWDGGAFEIYAASHVLMRGNRMWNNENVLETGTDGTLPCDANEFSRNVAYGDATEGRTWGMFLRCASNMRVANNTFYRLKRFVFSIGTGSSAFAGSIDGLLVANNIVSMRGGEIYGLVSALPGSVRIDRNLLDTNGDIASVYGRGSTTRLTTFRTWTGFERTGFRALPGFVSASRRDFHLRAGSAAVDRGLVLAGISDSFHGAAPDLGRYER